MSHQPFRIVGLHFVLVTAFCAAVQSPVRGELPVVLKQPLTSTSTLLLPAYGDPSAGADTKNDGLRPLAAEDPVCMSCSDWCVPRWTARLDALVWWAKGNQVPPLVTTSPENTLRPDAGVLGRPGTTILHGGEAIDGNYRPGVRVAVGYWLDDCRERGLDFVWFSLADGANSGNYYHQSLGNPILARPFYDAQTDLQNSELVAFPDIIVGDIQVLTSSELHSFAALYRRTLADSCRGQLGLLAGYRFLRYREGLTVEENLTSIDDGGVVAVGTTIDVRDAFSTGNDFHGAEVGLAWQQERGAWSWDALAKVAVGNMRQVVDISGFNRVTVPQTDPVTREGGLLAQPTNIGSDSRDKFTMIPELNLNARYHVTERLDVSLGYTLVWVTNVARTGDQIDFAVNPSQLPGNGGNLTGPARPAPRFEDTSMWIQGFNLGLVYEF